MASLLEQWLALAMPMLEVLFFNLLTFELCARRRYSLRYTAGVLAAFTTVFPCGVDGDAGDGLSSGQRADDAAEFSLPAALQIPL